MLNAGYLFERGSQGDGGKAVGGDEVARRSKYDQWLTDDGITLIRGWARDGLTNEQIAHNMGIAAGTLYGWQNKYVKIDEALRQSKEIVDYEVENALLKAALEGNVTAMIFWLKNRRVDKWRDRRDIESEGGLIVQHCIPDSDE